MCSIDATANSFLCKFVVLIWTLKPDRKKKEKKKEHLAMLPKPLTAFNKHTWVTKRLLMRANIDRAALDRHVKVTNHAEICCSIGI